ncbi:tyrosine-type recombinase/integrase [Paenibacillus albidus]|uniref:tyrosine-type recombinase/integrase n=1 Tax=Paenibacillus albidus TaxID=2041023 RepID=UPI001BEB4639|nr:tyrosine-type recombinase/integrase [Paenibacillus albidus]MBT2293721.1 tyrosine-type recombinase/integrase [Paenibacillus albidus]
MNNILFESKYYKFWYENVELLGKGDVQVQLRKFEKYLLLRRFQGELDFDKFHASQKYPGSFRPIQEYFIDQYVEYLLTDYRASNFVMYNAISSLKNFFSFLYDMDLIQHNPMEDYPNPYYDRPIKNTALSKEECLTLLEIALKKEPFFRQEFVLIWFMLITGARNSEVRFLSEDSVNLESRIVLIRNGQKGDARPTSITTALSEELRRYMNHPNYISWTDNNNDTLFFKKKKRLTSPGLRKVVRDLCFEANLSRVITPHDLRRTSGYLMQSAGINMVAIQKQLGHQILSTTLRYVPPLNDLAEILVRSDDSSS